MTSRLLINEPPLQVLPSLACAIGLNNALFIQQVHYWLCSSKHEHEGRRWVYNTTDQWHAQFPFWSRKTVERTIVRLEDEGFLIAGNFNALKLDRTKWYTIDYARLDAISETLPLRQSDVIQNDAMTQAIPETTTTEKEDRDSLRSSLSRVPRKRDAVWDAAAALCGAPETKNERSDFGETISQLREVGATPEQIGGFGPWWYENHNVRMTHRCLRDHWGSYKNAPPRPVPVPVLKNGHASPRDNVSISLENIRRVGDMIRQRENIYEVR